MRRKPLPFCALLLGALAAVVSLAPGVRGQSASLSPGNAPPALAPPANAPRGSAATVNAPERTEWLHRGQALEVQHRWGEALTHYEEALRQFPGDGGLKNRFDLARTHYELGRRYSDRSFRDGLTRMSLQGTLDLYGDVLLKVQAHYVEVPRWKELIDRGTSGLEVALGEPAFLQANAPRANEQAVGQFREEIRRLLGPRNVRSRGDARDAVAAAAGLASERLGLPPNAVVMEYACGAASALDAYSTYLTPEQLTEVYSQIEGNFIGLGVELKAVDGSLLIVRVIPNSPAKRAGLREGDRIVAVDGRTIRSLSTDHAADLLQGDEGTTVALSVLSPGSPQRDVSLRRQRVEVPSVDEAQLLDRSNGIAYLKLTCFQKTTYRDLDSALWGLHRAGMRGLIIDLRGNPGGLLASAVDVADLFLARGVIVTTRGRGVHEDYVYSAREAGTWRVPLVVLVDQDSASAAEIFAGAIRDHRRGTVVGTRSYGKGSVQGIFPLSLGNAGIRLTTAKFYSPAGYPYSGVGVEPDVVVRQAAKPLDDSSYISLAREQDAMLAAALQVAEQMLAQR